MHVYMYDCVAGGFLFVCLFVFGFIIFAKPVTNDV